MALAILEQESPVREDVLARQSARAHGFRRTGSRQRQRILELVRDAASTEESSGRFLWNSDGPMATVPFRYPRNEDERRSIDEIAIAELLGLIQENRHFLDRAASLCFLRLLGCQRLGHYFSPIPMWTPSSWS